MSWSYSSPPPEAFDPRWQQLYANYSQPTASGVPAPYPGVSQQPIWQDPSLPIPREGYITGNPSPPLYVGAQGYAPAVAPSDPVGKAPETPVTSYSTLQSALSLPPTTPRSPTRPGSAASSAASSTPSTSASPIRQCSHCQTTTTPLWRRDSETLELVCNACGLYQQQHACHRPAHLIAADGPAEDSGPPAGHDGRVCTHCGAYRTSVWRRNKEGAVLCNACGVYLRLKGVDRPVAFHGQKIRPRARGGDKSGAAVAGPAAASGA